MYCNIATYKFISLVPADLPSICKHLKQLGSSYSLKGTILLSTEGINLFLAGKKESIEKFIEAIATYPMFTDLPYKFSYSEFIPFKKLSVKIRNEIVTFKQEHIHPEQFTAPYITPAELKSWLETQQEFLLLDTRNTFEFEVGTFEQAVNLGIQNFREFPEAVEKSNLDDNKPIVTYCTGGIRCEKAAAYLLEKGFKEVYQLQGGILNYFEQCGGAFFKGNCFVFDDRISLDSKLDPVNSPEKT